MNLWGLGVITILGVIMAISGLVGVVYYVARYRRTRDRLEQNGAEDPDTPSNTLGTFLLFNGFLHIGMLLLVLGGVGLIYYGQR